MPDFELHAFVEDGSTRKPFYLRISEPSKASDAQDYFCRVHAPALLGEDKNIFGVDEVQAKALAFDFIRSLLIDKRLVDKRGEAIEL
jgi:hypothetical protein